MVLLVDSMDWMGTVAFLKHPLKHACKLVSIFPVSRISSSSALMRYLTFALVESKCFVGVDKSLSDVARLWLQSMLGSDFTNQHI